jgi:16S rRNA (guanine1516-N2)-methyltransferase
MVRNHLGHPYQDPPSPVAVALDPEAIDRHADALALASELALPLVSVDERTYRFLLVLTPTRLELRATGPQALGPVFADFSGDLAARRGRWASRRSELVVRAVAGTRVRCRTVIDATAGLGRDAFVLANAGLRVHMMERSAVVAALLEDALRRARAEPALPAALARMSLSMGESGVLLAQIHELNRPDTVYLDPMHPERKKSALTRKEMRLFRGVVGKDPDAPALLEVALASTRHRVVVKRPRLAPPIAGPIPTARLESRTIRFDIYAREALHSGKS